MNKKANLEKEFVITEDIKKTINYYEDKYEFLKKEYDSKKKRIQRNRILYKTLILIGICFILIAIAFFLLNINFVIGKVHINNDVLYSLLYTGLSITGFSAVIYQLHEAHQDSLENFRKEILIGNPRALLNEYVKYSLLASFDAIDKIGKEFSHPDNIKKMSPLAQKYYYEGLINVTEYVNFLQQKINSAKNVIVKDMLKEHKESIGRLSKEKGLTNNQLTPDLLRKTRHDFKKKPTSDFFLPPR